MKKLGFLMHQMLPNQKTNALSINLNEMVQKYPDIDPILFFNDIGMCNIKNEFAVMQTIEALDYDGILIATDEISVNMFKACMRAKEKYFYVWDINWFYNPRPISNIKSLYLNDDVKLIARSKSHFDIISRVFKKPEYIIQDFNVDEIKSIIYDR